jgi:hypothetical protein
MVAAEQTHEEADRKALEALVVENDDLDELEARLAQFNIFEAIGAVRHELRHSDVLAFLLDPSQTHALGDAFLRRFLQRALANSSRTDVTAVHLDLYELDEADVRREWANIDVLVIDERNKLAVVIENKIDSTEHSGQLQRYWESVKRDYPGHRLLAFYLTPDGDEPSDANYVAIDYELIAELVGRTLKTRSNTLGPDVRVLLEHYLQMLRRHIVTDSEVADLCRQIYRKHRRALDLILEHRPDPHQDFVRALLEKLIQSNDALVLDDCTRTSIRFAAKAWDLPLLKQGRGWTKTGRILLFEFRNSPEKLQLQLLIGPGPTATRQRLFELAMADSVVFRRARKNLSNTWSQIYARGLLQAKDYEDQDEDGIEKAVRAEWNAFVTTDLPLILAHLADGIKNAQA